MNPYRGPKVQPSCTETDRSSLPIFEILGVNLKQCIHSSNFFSGVARILVDEGHAAVFLWYCSLPTGFVEGAHAASLV